MIVRSLTNKDLTGRYTLPNATGDLNCPGGTRAMRSRLASRFIGAILSPPSELGWLPLQLGYPVSPAFSTTTTHQS